MVAHTYSSSLAENTSATADENAGIYSFHALSLSGFVVTTPLLEI
jgi:hypothetical protein